MKNGTGSRPCAEDAGDSEPSERACPIFQHSQLRTVLAAAGRGRSPGLWRIVRGACTTTLALAGAVAMAAPDASGWRPAGSWRSVTRAPHEQPIRSSAAPQRTPAASPSAAAFDRFDAPRALTPRTEASTQRIDAAGIQFDPFEAVGAAGAVSIAAAGDAADLPDETVDASVDAPQTEFPVERDAVVEAALAAAKAAPIGPDPDDQEFETDEFAAAAALQTGFELPGSSEDEEQLGGLRDPESGIDAESGMDQELVIPEPFEPAADAEERNGDDEQGLPERSDESDLEEAFPEPDLGIDDIERLQPGVDGGLGLGPFDREMTPQERAELRRQLEQERIEHQQDCEEFLSAVKADSIRSVSLDIRMPGEAGEDYPFSCGLGADAFRPRSWPQVTYLWKASALCHKPLYFEQVQVERYGHSWNPVLQPVLSGAHFFGSAALLPYKMGLEAPNECIYTLGYYRPGSCAPYMIEAVPFTWRAALYQGAAVGAGVAIFP